MSDHQHPEYPTVKDVYELVEKWGDKIHKGMETLENATNHKIDILRSQGMKVLAIFAVISVPVILNNWGAMLKQLQGMVF